MCKSRQSFSLLKRRSKGFRREAAIQVQVMAVLRCLIGSVNNNFVLSGKKCATLKIFVSLSSNLL